MRCFCPALASVGGDSNATGREWFSRLRCWPPGGHVPAVGRQHSPPRDVARRWTPTCFRREHLSVRLCQVRPFPLQTAQPQSVASWLRPHPAPRPATLAAGVGTHAGPRLLFLPPPGASDVFPALGPCARIRAVARPSGGVPRASPAGGCHAEMRWQGRAPRLAGTRCSSSANRFCLGRKHLRTCWTSSAGCPESLPVRGRGGRVVGHSPGSLPLERGCDSVL